MISLRDILHSRKLHRENQKKYGIKAFLKNLRNWILEFGPAEVIDSFMIRPFFMWLFPILLNNFPLGIIIGKTAADIIFYIPAIIVYELRKKHLID